MIELREKDFSIDDVLRRIKSESVGAVVYFIGMVRDGVKQVNIKCQEGIAEQDLERLEKQALERFEVEKTFIMVRRGSLHVTENITLIAVAAKHRQPAFAACEFLIDGVKGLASIQLEEIK